MSVYRKLLYHAGGGIVSSTQMAGQVTNTATVLIGLGGTGINSIRTIKTQLYSSVMPDDPGAEDPQYKHIRFLGVDSNDIKYFTQHEEELVSNSQKIRGLEKDEFFSIFNPYLREVLSHPNVIKKRDELAWFNWEELDAPMLSNNGSSCVRQVGRFLMMDKSKEFMSRIEQEINAAKDGLVNPIVNVHIFSGLTGGTGSGCFLDVCYMVQHIVAQMGGAMVFGYFFLPEVNLSLIPDNNSRWANALRRNGYAAMQELDYCMQFPKNGGAFSQKYQDGIEIRWDYPPVNVCFLIGAADTSGTFCYDAYANAMEVTAQYIVDCLTYGAEMYSHAEWAANAQYYLRTVGEKKPVDGNIGYHTLGAASATIPFRKINTYLASELFNRFSEIKNHVPTKKDVEYFAVSALTEDSQSVFDIYTSLWREICDGFDDSYGAFCDDWNYVRDYGDSQMITHYTNQTAAKLNIAKKNAKSMTSAGNQRSLIGRVEKYLHNLIRNIDYGPMFAYKMLCSAKGHNLIALIDALIMENNMRWDQEDAQYAVRLEDYERAKDEFDSRKKRNLFDNDAKRFANYEHTLMLLEQHKMKMECYRELNDVLTQFRMQIGEKAKRQYGKLATIMSNLLDTFEENRNRLRSDELERNNSASSRLELVTIGDLKKTLDAEIENLNVPRMYDAFMRRMLADEEIWIDEDENKVTEFVSEFSINIAFVGFSSRTITSFLKDKYGIADDNQLANTIYNKYMEPLTAKAKPLFCFSSEVWREEISYKQNILSVPSCSSPIRLAAEQVSALCDGWRVRECSMEDRISTITVLSGFPICSSTFIPSACVPRMSSGPGLYSYEGKPNFGMVFNDWRKLPPLKP